MNIVITTIPHNSQRYNTAGDWQFDASGSLTISVSELGDWRYEVLVAVHELVEALLCRSVSMRQEAVDEFDMTWQLHDGIEEPGDDPAAPYYRHHRFADFVERALAWGLRVNWREYEGALNALG